jgi:succinate dehydrogenase flavin-adding protein (antitoxin of CptAB toxin-antitoxin module)
VRANAESLRRLRWRARRGLLENDLLLARFLDRHGDGLNDDQVSALASLLELPDTDLLDLLLDRSLIQLTDSAQLEMLRVLRTF